MQYFSAIASQNIVRRTDTLPHQGDPRYWIVVPVEMGVTANFALLNDETDWIGRIISALTQSGVYHVEMELDDDSCPLSCWHTANTALYEPYDFDGALLAANNSGYHTPDKEFCSGLAYEILSPIVPGLTRYPNPGKLLSELPSMIGLPQPKLAVEAMRAEAITEADLDQLRILPAAYLATGVKQQVFEALGRRL